MGIDTDFTHSNVQYDNTYMFQWDINYLPDTTFNFTESITKVDIYPTVLGIARIVFYYTGDVVAIDLQGTEYNATLAKQTFTVPNGEFLYGQTWTSDGIQQTYTY